MERRLAAGFGHSERAKPAASQRSVTCVRISDRGNQCVVNANRRLAQPAGSPHFLGQRTQPLKRNLFMPTSSLVLTLNDDESAYGATLGALHGRPEIDVGYLADGRWLPIVMDTATESELRHLHDWMRELPGVAYLDVVSVGREESQPATRTASSPQV
jgi:hypothetical protein